MFWMRRPPYLRWAAAAAILIAAILLELGEAARVSFPFAAEAVAAGTPFSDAAIDYKEIPRGMMATPALSGAVAGRDIDRGEPIVTSAVASAPLIPDDWWAVPLTLPQSVSPGTAIRLVVLDPPLAVDGVVVESGGPGAFGSEMAGLVAIPAEGAATIAAAAAAGRLTLLVAP